MADEQKAGVVTGAGSGIGRASAIALVSLPWPADSHVGRPPKAGFHVR